MARKKVIKAENPYTQTSHSQQNNYRPIYWDNINYQQGWNLVKGQQTGLGLANETILGHSIVSTIVDGSIGTGLSCESVVDEVLLSGLVSHEQVMEIQKKLESLFLLWAKNPQLCDRRQVSNMAELERQMLTMAVVQGECFVLIRIAKSADGFYFPQLELVPPSLVCSPSMSDTPNIVSGIEFDNKGREVAFWVKVVSADSPTSSRWERIPKYSRTGRLQMIHMKSGVIQPNQARGTSTLMALSNNLVQIDRFNEANAAKAVIQSAIGFQVVKDKDVIEKPENEIFEDLFSASQETEASMGQFDFPSPNKTISIKPGVTMDLPAGYKLETVESTAPTVNYWDFINGNLKLMSGGRLPAPEKIMKSYLASYSASQASMQESQRVFELWVGLLADGILNEVYKQYVWCLAAQDILEMPGFFDNSIRKEAWSGCEWYGPALVHNDPVKAVKASILRLNAGLSTRKREAHILTGQKWSSLINESAEEMKAMQDLGFSPVNSEKVDITESDENEENGEE